jgi:hypothetical protein
MCKRNITKFILTYPHPPNWNNHKQGMQVHVYLNMTLLLNKGIASRQVNEMKTTHVHVFSWIIPLTYFWKSFDYTLNLFSHKLPLNHLSCMFMVIPVWRVGVCQYELSYISFAHDWCLFMFLSINIPTSINMAI